MRVIINGEKRQTFGAGMPGNVWMPVNNGEDEVEPKEGADIISTMM